MNLRYKVDMVLEDQKVWSSRTNKRCGPQGPIKGVVLKVQ